MTRLIDRRAFLKRTATTSVAQAPGHLVACHLYGT